LEVLGDLVLQLERVVVQGDVHVLVLWSDRPNEGLLSRGEGIGLDEDVRCDGSSTEERTART
jgi:hypothetical protein